MQKMTNLFQYETESFPILFLVDAVSWFIILIGTKLCTDGMHRYNICINLKQDHISNKSYIIQPRLSSTDLCDFVLKFIVY
jgi:hypothetical protein